MRRLLVACLITVGLTAATASAQKELFTADHVAKMRNVGTVRISPSGTLVAYTLTVQRTPHEDEDGPAWVELHVVNLNGNSRAFVTGKVNVSHVKWTPDGSGISFTAKRGDDEHKRLYVIPIDGGEARAVVTHETDIGEYAWSPDGVHVAFLAKEKEDKRKKDLKESGFKAEVYEEDFQPVRVWNAKVDDDAEEPAALELPGFPSSLHWSPDGEKLAVALAPTPLVDDRYMKREINIVEADTGSVLANIGNVGKLGDVAWSPDGQRLAFLSGENINDPSAGRLMVAPATGGKIRDVVPNYMGQVEAIQWRDNKNVMYVGSEGCYTSFNRVNVESGVIVTIVPTPGPILRSLSLSGDGQTAAFAAETPRHPREVYTMKHGDFEPHRLTDSNPWLKNVKFARQSVISYNARDGLKIEGILIQPLKTKGKNRDPLIMTVHGGPESHYADGFVTRYSGGGQIAAARGFVVFYPNYRGSTGRGVEFSKKGQADYAGGEFNDLVDALDHLEKVGLIDRKKVGVTGGSYGGFASAWCATKLTKHFAAAVMFVGISDQISKFGTTDIPNEMYHVHSRTWPWENWEFFRERSPISYVQQARTPLLILHGKNDTRVHPSQSMELYRYLKTLGHVPVRLVFYPGEGHGNRKAAGRYDYTLRLMRWMQHYLQGPGGDPPPYEIDYGFDDADDASDKD